MPDCRHCGRNAGFFSDMHPACQEALDADREGVAAISAILMAGRIPEVNIVDLPLVLPKNEHPIWCYTGVQEIEQASRRRHVGGSQGVSIRLMKGISFRVGAMQGTSVSESYERAVDTGIVILTTDHLFFIGQSDTDVLELKSLIFFDAKGDTFSADDRRQRLNLRMRNAEDAMTLERLVRLVIDLPADAEFGVTLQASERPPLQEPPPEPASLAASFAAPAPASMHRVFGKRKVAPL